MQELERQGLGVDLNIVWARCARRNSVVERCVFHNHIDTALITTMGFLFYDSYIRNIKIDQWDVPVNAETCDLFTTIVDYLYSPQGGYSRKVCGYT